MNDCKEKVKTVAEKYILFPDHCEQETITRRAILVRSTLSLSLSLSVFYVCTSAYFLFAFPCVDAGFVRGRVLVQRLLRT
jgi:hypothetical protein